MLSAALLIARKDFKLLFTRGGSVVQAFLLGLLLFFLFSLSRPVGALISPQAAAAIFWLATLFCQILIYTALFSLEEENTTRTGLLLSPAPVQAVWLGKACAGLLTLLCAQAIFVPAAVVFLGQHMGPAWPTALAGLLLADAGIAALGALLGALAQGGGGRESLLSVLCFPLLVPLLLAAIRLGTLAFEPAVGNAHAAQAGNWIAMLAAFDALFAGAGLLLFPFVYTDE